MCCFLCQGRLPPNFVGSSPILSRSEKLSQVPPLVAFTDRATTPPYVRFWHFSDIAPPPALVRLHAERDLSSPAGHARQTQTLGIIYLTSRLSEYDGTQGGATGCGAISVRLGRLPPFMMALSIILSRSFVVTTPALQWLERNMHIRTLSMVGLALAFALNAGTQMSFAEDLNTVPVSAPIHTDFAGRSGDVATHAVIRLVCPAQGTVGTGFLHKSGNLITADHVVRGCPQSTMVMPNGTLSPVTVIASDQNNHDLALVKPTHRNRHEAIRKCGYDDFKIAPLPHGIPWHTAYCPY